MGKVRTGLLQQLQRKEKGTSLWEPSTVAKIMMDNALQELNNFCGAQTKDESLNHMLTIGCEYLTAADEQKLFTVPVLDAVSPGYSTRIPNVMSLSMMRARLHHRLYTSLGSFTEDVHLMLNNYSTFHTSPEASKV